jgi:hypothetical protein
MVSIRLKATLNSSGELDFDLPNPLPSEDFELILDVVREDKADNELFGFLNKPAREIEIGGWEDYDLPDSAEYVEELRRKEEERNTRWTLS